MARVNNVFKNTLYTAFSLQVSYEKCLLFYQWSSPMTFLKFYTWFLLVHPTRVIGWILGLPPQLQSQPRHLWGSEFHKATRAQLYWKDTAPKLSNEFFRSIKKKKKGYFFFRVTEKFAAASTQPPSSLRSQALFLTLCTDKIPFYLPFIFIFTWKAEKSWAFMCNKHQLDRFFAAH